MVKYHHTTGLPPAFRAPSGVFPLKYTVHAMDEAVNDRFGDLRPYLPESLDTSKGQLIEIEQELGRTVRLLYRFKTDHPYVDLIMRVDIRRYLWRVVTVWGNHMNDHHASLRMDQYVRVCPN